MLSLARLSYRNARTMRLRPSAFLLHQLQHHGSTDRCFSTIELNPTLHAGQNISIADITRRTSSSSVKVKTSTKTPALGKSAQRLHNRKKKGTYSLRKKQNAQDPFINSAGRPIMTEGRLQSYPSLSSYDMTTMNHPKSVLNNITKHKLQYVQHLAFDTMGPPGDQQFLATTTTSFEYEGITKEFICSGLGRTKKAAEFYAALDLIKALQEVGIDATNPPDLQAVRERRSEEVFQENVAKVQMLLELLDASRPKFTVEAADKGGWRASVGVWVRGEFFTAVGPVGKNKAKAEGLALLELVNGEEKELIDAINASEDEDVIQRYLDLIEASPGKHIAALRVPPLPNEIAWDMIEAIGIYNGRHEKRMQLLQQRKAEYEERYGVGGRKPFRHRRARRSHVDYARINDELKKEEEQKSQHITDDPDGKHSKIKAARSALPITAIRTALLDALKTDQVVVVSGGTGSGKSTQCPQYILEDALLSSNGAQTEIIVTQPRKIAAVSVAERVADERHEKIGNSVGYTVRFNRKAPREAGGTIEFVTTGVLLNRIMNDPLLEGVSHVVIDEVHERDINTDFLLILLRDLLKKRPELRVVLMSATLNASSFAEYFNKVNRNGECKHLSVPTEPRHPVDVFYLEDIMSMDHDVQDLARTLLQYHDEKLRVELEEAESEVAASLQLEKRAHDEDEGLLLDCDSDSDDDDSKGEYVSPTSPASRVKALRRALSLRCDPDDSMPVEVVAGDREAGGAIVQLVSKLALHLSRNEIASGRKGSILCFLPGWDEIKDATKQLEEEADPDLRSKIMILPLHSTIPHEDQQKVFNPAEDGTVKVILSTNIAESSITIDDVLAVVDGGLVRELSYDAESAMSMMDTVAVSKASATQRLGRAGRVAPGKCYRLYSRGFHEAMPERPTPEMQRTALENTCLQTSTISNEIEGFLAQAMDPPPSESVHTAVNRLSKLGALEIKETSRGNCELLTPLGCVLSRLPVDPSTGRMLILGVVMKCLDPVVTAAACFSSRSVFYNPPGLRDEAQQIRRSFSSESDTTAQIRAYNKFWDIVQYESWDNACSWAKEHYVSIVAMISIKNVRTQLLNEMRKLGFIESEDMYKISHKEYALKADSSLNANAENELLHNAVLASSIPGNISSRRQLGNFGTLRTKMEGHAELHPSSVSFFRRPPRDVRLPTWYLYREMVLSSQVFLRECSAMKPEQILLFGGYTLNTCASSSMNPIHLIDDWIVAESTCDDTIRVLVTARKDINAALEQKVMHPRRSISFETQDAIDSIVEMFDVLYFGDQNDEYIDYND